MENTGDIEIQIDEQPVDGAAALAFVARPDAGGQTLFVGTVRNHHQGREVVRLAYEAYIPMAQALLTRIAREAQDRFGLAAVAIRHATGTLEIGDAAVAVAASAAHRAETFQAVAWMMNAIKLDVPIFKHETYTDGTSEWVQCTHVHSEGHNHDEH